MGSRECRAHGACGAKIVIVIVIVIVSNHFVKRGADERTSKSLPSSDPVAGGLDEVRNNVYTRWCQEGRPTLSWARADGEGSTQQHLVDKAGTR